MKLEGVKEKIAGAIQKAEKITSKNQTLPVLKCVLLDVQKNSLLIKATNLDIGIEITLPVKTEGEGRVAVPGSTLSGLLSQLSNDKSVTLEAKDGNLYVSSSKNKALIRTLPDEEYPSIPQIDRDASKSFKISSQSLVSGLKAVWYSSATSSIKPELSSVRIYPLNNQLVFVATDGFRLAEKSVAIKNMPDFTHILVPVKNAGEIIRVFDDLDEELEVFVDNNQIAVISKDIYLVSRVIEGNFPDYKAIIPKEFLTEVTFLKQDFINTIKINTIFSDSFNHVKFLIEPDTKKIQLSTKNNDVGESATDVSGTIKGAAIDVNFNYKYINDAMQAINSDSVNFLFSGNNKPLVIKAVGDQSFMYLVMPMNR
jgi:DNA polymerase-3 subunit beta